MPDRKRELENDAFPVAYTVDFRGVNDDCPAFLFACADPVPLVNIFRLLRNDGYVMDRYEFLQEHALKWRNGKNYWRWVFVIIGFHPGFMSLDELRVFIEGMLTNKGHKVTYFKDINKFLNI